MVLPYLGHARSSGHATGHGYTPRPCLGGASSLRGAELVIGHSPLHLIKNTPVALLHHLCYTSDMIIIKPISVRMNDPLLYQRVVAIAEEQDISLNLATQLLLGYAFSQIDQSGKQFKAKVVFEAES